MSYVRVKGWPAVSYIVLGPEKVWEPWTCLLTADDGTEYEEETGEGEWVEGDGSRVRVRMVGDDHVEVVDADRCIPIEREVFCGECGQIGCAHDGYEREEA